MISDKPHYYDGRLYDILFERALREVRDIIAGQIAADSKVLDIACGTGSLVFDLADKCTFVTGVELSSKMVGYAKKRQQANSKQNVTFIHGNATDLPQYAHQEFDYLTIAMALHEMPPELREQVLQEAKRIAKKIIIADYMVPQALSFAGIRTYLVEFLAGLEHFKGFQHFQNNNGIDQLLQNCQLSICHEAINQKQTIRVVVAN